jgi:hypothetical protein
VFVDNIQEGLTMKRVATMLVLAMLALCVPDASAAPPCDPSDFTIANCSLPMGTLGEEYEATVATIGCDINMVGGGGMGFGGCSVFWAIVGLPNGLTFSPSGEATLVSGIPLETGDFVVTISATDMYANGNMGCETSCTTTITIGQSMETVPPEYLTPGNNLLTYPPSDDSPSKLKCWIGAAPIGAGGGTALAGLLVLAALAVGMKARRR